MNIPTQKIFFNQQQIEWQDILQQKKISDSTYANFAFSFLQKWLAGEQKFALQTSGSTGKPKKIIVTREQLIASAIATGNALQLKANQHALLALSAQYIAGIMMLTRAMVWQQHIYITEPSNNPLQNFSDQQTFDFVALVPLQIQTLIDTFGLNTLSRLKKILIGGAPLSNSLKEKIAHAESDVYLTYGMTETISHIALQKISGENKQERFYPLPGIQLFQNENSCLRIRAPYLAEDNQTHDVVKLYDDKSFEWLGRADFVINSGGIKIHPEEIENKIESILRALAIDTYFVSALPDDKLGEKLILLIESNESISTVLLLQQLKETLPPYQNPKEIYILPQFKRTENGKLNRKATLDLVKVVG
ncbi:MAG: AMP-binding protein [Cyclobacteriaceae bacterium]|jgi:O-succinylbenzoic acid--CoA ligase|nr:AMP-binding protein [Cyclobacteriaceae bacterium]